jgi:hypothetical protein
MPPHSGPARRGAGVHPHPSRHSATAHTSAHTALVRSRPVAVNARRRRPAPGVSGRAWTTSAGKHRATPVLRRPRSGVPTTDPRGAASAPHAAGAGLCSHRRRAAAGVPRQGGPAPWDGTRADPVPHTRPERRDSAGRPRGRSRPERRASRPDARPAQPPPETPRGSRPCRWSRATWVSA